MIKRLFLFIGFLSIWFNCYAYEFPLIRLKSSGEFQTSSFITEEENYDRLVNFNNVSTVRKVGKCSLLIDNNININCESELARAEFLNKYEKFINLVESPTPNTVGIIAFGLLGILALMFIIFFIVCVG